MKKVFTGLALTLAIGSAQAAEFSGTVGFTNDYRFRGISQTMGDAAIQGSLDVAFDNGIYAGAWGSNVDFGPGDDANLEIDYYVGYANDINEDLSYDAFIAYYTYPGYDAADGDYIELNAALYYADFGLSYAYTDDYFNGGLTSQYIALDYSYALTDAVSLDLHAGHSFDDAWDDAYGDSYEDYSIGLSGSAAGFDLSVAYLDNSLPVAETNDSDDSTVVFSISRSF